MKAEQVIKALRRRHGTKGLAAEWAFFTELYVGNTGYRPQQQRIDAFAINCYPSKNFLRVAYEVKVSRSDFLHEIKQPEKRSRAMELSNQFYFAVPKGLVRVEVIPEDCGLIYVSLREDGTTFSRVVKEAPIRSVKDPDMAFLSSIARRIAEAEKSAESA